jgi:OPA family glycerol-3-phosphate transporter-like MFS transporter/OPA family sugar phosphate sensor protein UhpC-like MFS transporter
MAATPVPAGVTPSSDDSIRQYRYWQNRLLLSTIVGYALFYFVRKNLSVAMPAMEQTLNISKTELGLFLTLHGVVYGVSKFFNGFLADRVSARWFIASGLAICAVLNFAFGMGSTAVVLGVIWLLNGWFQGMGFPPIARLMTHWFSPRVLATKMCIWNTSHSIGASLVVILCGYLVHYDWRLCFYVPAALAFVGAVALMFALRDTPESMGLPPVPGTEETPEQKENGPGVWRLVFCNRYIWLVSLANFFVYTVRYGILDWGPTFLKQSRHIDITKASWMVAAFEVSGILGTLLGGWITDRVFGGRGARACLVYMVCCAISLTLFWQWADAPVAVSAFLLCTAGFFIYGPQALVAIIAANLATKKAAGSAAGFTGLFGYFSTVLSGVGVGWLAQRNGWDAGFLMFVVAAVLGAGLFALCWPAKAHGYGEE